MLPHQCARPSRAAVPAVRLMVLCGLISAGGLLTIVQLLTVR